MQSKWHYDHSDGGPQGQRRRVLSRLWFGVGTFFNDFTFLSCFILLCCCAKGFISHLVHVHCISPSTERYIDTFELPL